MAQTKAELLVCAIFSNSLIKNMPFVLQSPRRYGKFRTILNNRAGYETPLHAASLKRHGLVEIDTWHSQQVS
ncbi:MAG: hypothetical protein AB1469_00585 [Pseudomonadota bacterium]